MKKRCETATWLLLCLAGLMLFAAGCGGTKGMHENGSGEEYRADGSAELKPDTSESSNSDIDKVAALPADSESILDDELLEQLVLDPEWQSDSETNGNDSLWRMFAMAEEYYAMGGIANREGGWEEAQYYFERALKVLAGLDVQTDSTLTPEAVKYNTLLDNIVADYRVALRSLGRLGEDAAPSAIIERFGDLESKLEHDSMVVFRREGGPASYDLPVIMNDRVRSSIVYFQTVANDAFRRYLSRSKKYNHLFSKVLAEYGLPQDLVYLSLVESGYNPHAYSWARAVGLWQFIASTGKLYGLERNWWIDERKDPVKSTRAAARFLKDLYDKFGKWDLAMAAYNGGPGRVDRTMKSQRTDDFWKLRLRRQTMDYVPLIYAATIIAKEPAKYGFGDVPFEPPVYWDEVIIDRCLDLRDVASRVGCSVDTLKVLNPELLRVYTPPNDKNYSLKIPMGLKQSFWAVYEQLESPKEAAFAHHKVRKRESIASIASKYGVSQYAILEANNLSKGVKLKAGRDLIIPIPADHASTNLQTPSRKLVKTVIKPGDVSGGVYTVREGDTMWDIARGLGVTVDELRRVNNMDKRARLRIGQKLQIPASAMNAPPSPTSRTDTGKARSARPVDTADKVSVYTVRAGDSIWGIARLYGTSVEQIRRLNGLSNSSRIHAGQELIVPAERESAEYVVYQVKYGDTLTRIAQKYRTTIDKILSMNSLDDPHQLKIGDRIKIAVD